MMSDLLIDAGLGFAGGAFGQGACELLKIASDLVRGISAAALQNREQDREDAKLNNKNANDAAKRNPAWLRGAVTIIIVLAAFWGLYLVALQGIDWSLIVEKKPWLNIFDLITLGGGTGVKSGTGLVIPEYFQRGTIMVISALTGIAALRTGR